MVSPLAGEKKKMSLVKKIFIGLIGGVIVGYILNFLGGTENPFIADYVFPFLSFVGNLFIRLIRMVVVPLVLFCIIDAAVSLGDIKKLRSIGVKTIVFFLASGMIAAGIGLVIVNIVKPGIGITIGEMANEITVNQIAGPYETILNMIPLNPFTSLSSGDMLPIIVFALFLGLALIALGEKAAPVANGIKVLSDAMFRMILFILGIIPYGVFGLMAVALGTYGIKIFGPVLKFIAVDYLANFIMVAGVYSLFLTFIARVSIRTFWKHAFEPWLLAFSACTTNAALPRSMKVAPRLGVPKEISNFVLPLGATANMNGTCIYFAIIVLFAAQLYGVDLPISQQILAAGTATLLSVGCAATPQIGLVISTTLLTSLGFPLDAIALVAGIYRIVDQAHTSTNATGDIVTSLCIAAMQGELDREQLKVAATMTPADIIEFDAKAEEEVILSSNV
ncbi:dicarboxylate/amino acid:cation symporter [Sinanaerobacter chloroacetimidivorans]|jgi:Na+/H+-dicarboxylate symporter|uniref:Dicarboxylate/amino acid:cation symporter n=1 Tax=Sinanaerobacter chloroacetimidivorans TaxID=2818044 RepID=A0A8J7W811_9FIRM|nr:dicarboxylate/amino acid:cation symporter [Sinanaerobacter chloroacetimidivorans]MBR0600631.1 dicarboxylate/amino acid:cation symporter [Sinanaerobacter chloroacetimidivorans]